MHQDTFEDFADDVQAARREWRREMRQREREILADHRGVVNEFNELAV